MKKNIAFLLFLICSITSFGQIIEPVKWKSEYKKIDDTNGELIFTATIEDGWSIYSQYIDEGGPIPTTFTFENPNNDFELVGKTEEGKPVLKFDKIFEMDMAFFYDKAVFTQKINLKNTNIDFIDVLVEYQTCDDEKCIFESSEFHVPLSTSNEVSNDAINLSANDLEKANALKLDLKGKETYLKDANEEDKSYLTIFLLGFLGGLIALLTPCVFPMIPLTVSFFTKGAKDKKKGLGNAILYGLFIFIIYILLSLPFHLLDSVDPEILNNISTNVTLNIIFFIIFVVFAFSFFGYFELTLPSSWSSKMDNKATSIGGIVGIFFMALTLAIVSFSCTGPILGSLLGGSLSSDGGAMQLTFGMGGFGLALALPFALFALFPNWLNSLPKSGGWLNTVKVVLGFAELALAFKFLSNADLVAHWGILKREIFIGIWLLCALGMGLYLFGLIRFPHDGSKRKLPLGNIIIGLASFAFAIYLIPGLTNTKHANLKLLSGFAPPMFYSLYDKGTSAPLGLTAYKDFEKGLIAAKKEGKPIMIDFTGWACVNCRKMEEHVWSREDIFKVINEEYILISLYVDDREKLDPAEQFKFLKENGNTKTIRTIGDKWATFQTINFKNNSQPYYVLIDSNLNLINSPIAYTPNGNEYLAWLKEGMNNFSKL
ncbi:protein-disulfide reductase DsbD family protein [Patiriisocius hiemis]|uniref:Cytochrome c biogenesis protein CcdA n=1 Tax=Patiriisocius hiemis TaxID=3075604 RepID=A0ABU2YAZ8_9FLAO|nr:cytochrome c biogenesis protein CcdA [Constantimarinum sp. W242]MDT0555026.1 cytochrome c biogenesis protein CcdA [Constantimarinum sp. W242]